MKETPKIFLQGLSQFPQTMQEITKFNRLMTDKRLTQNEKKILESWLLLRDKEYDQIIALLTPMSCNIDIVESQRLLILGIAWNSKAQYQKALELVAQSLAKLPVRYAINLDTIRFRTLYNLFVINENLRDLNQMKKLLAKMSSTPIPPAQRIHYELCRLSYANQTEDFSSAERIIDNLSDVQEEMSEYQKITFSVELFQYYLLQNLYGSCEKVLQEISSTRKYLLSSDFRFMKQLLAYLTHDSTLYLYEADFTNSPERYLQVKTLLALEACNMDHAQQAWEELKAKNKELYQGNFVFKGQKCLFSLCLQKFLRGKESKIELVTISQIQSSSNKMEALYQILQAQTSPINKLDLYFLLWGEKPTDKFALNKLEKLVYRVRQEYSVTISSRKGCYFLSTKVKMAS
ncbi:MAG: hypothetical protein ACOYL6_14355 [Bacteriovoracaceae bacterium]